MRAGRRMSFDVGKVRTGVAASDSAAILASPLATIEARTIELLLQGALNLIAEVEPIEIYVGLPKNLQGQSTLSTNLGVSFAKQLHSLVSVPIRLVDERMTTKLAASALQSAGLNARQQKSRIDAVAAVVILESAMNHERQNASAPGIAIEEFEHEI